MGGDLGEEHPGYYNFGTGEYRFEHDPWVVKWVQRRMPSGRPYYVHSITEETSWDNPHAPKPAQPKSPTPSTPTLVEISSENVSGDGMVESKVLPSPPQPGEMLEGGGNARAAEHFSDGENSSDEDIESKVHPSPQKSTLSEKSENE